MKNKDRMPSPEEMAEIQEERTLSDAELIKGGAEYKSDEKGNVTLEPTRRQLKSIIKEHEEEVSIKDRLDGVIDTLKGALTGSNKTQEKKDKLELPEGAELLSEITIGGKTKEQLIEEMKKNNIVISSWAKKMMYDSHFTASEKLEHLNLVRISLKQLGFTDKTGATRGQIYEKAQELGLKLCPAEVGPQLSLQYGDQLKRRVELVIAMEPLNVFDRDVDIANDIPNVFCVHRENDSKLTLSSREYSSRYWWTGNLELVFCLPHKP